MYMWIEYWSMDPAVNVNIHAWLNMISNERAYTFYHQQFYYQSVESWFSITMHAYDLVYICIKGALRGQSFINLNKIETTKLYML